MAKHSLAQNNSASESSGIWASLKLAIAKSSGFNRWKSELDLELRDQTPIDQLIRLYLCETLKTLAY